MQNESKQNVKKILFTAAILVLVFISLSIISIKWELEHENSQKEEVAHGFIIGTDTVKIDSSFRVIEKK